MPLNAYEAAVGVFVRTLSNLKAQLAKAEAHVTASGADPAGLLNARLAQGSDAGASPHDLYSYTLAMQVHWATEGARLAVARIVGADAVPVAASAATFAELCQRIDATVVALQETAAAEIDAGMERTIVVAHRHGAVTATGQRFLLGYAIPHFFHHVSSAHNILRGQGVPLTMGDFLGAWGDA